MGIDIFIRGDSSLDRLINTILQIESRPRLTLVDRKTELNKTKAVLTDLDSKLSALESLSKRLTDPITDYFGAKSGSSSDTDLFTVSADSTALVGSHDIVISRLASADTRVSKQYTKTGTELSDFFSTNGSQTFQLEVAHPITSDSSNRVTISVAVNSTSTNNDDVLKDIALAVNNAMSSAVSAGTIDADEKVIASVVNEDDGSSRLIFKSSQSGFTNRMVMTDSANSLLSTLEISNNVQTSGTSGGYVTAIGTSATDSQLNSQLQVDGLTFYRDSNTINDIISGVTLTLKNVTTTTESFGIAEDVEAVKKEVTDFLTAYNDALQFLKDKTTVDADLFVRGPLAGSSTYRELRTKLINVMTSRITNVLSGNPEYLSEIGITAASNGSLSITDDSKFEKALQSGSKAISDVFNASDGVATQIKDLLDDYVKVGGFIDNIQSSISDRIKTLDSRIARMDDRLARREQLLRAQFAKMQEISALLQRQQFTLQNIFSSI
jgi:flagellar hook-associated protein 2